VFLLARMENILNWKEARYTDHDRALLFAVLIAKVMRLWEINQMLANWFIWWLLKEIF
jgi:hypothetical protein